MASQMIRRDWMYIYVSYLSFCLNLCANGLFLAGQKTKQTKKPKPRYDRGRVFSDYVTISINLFLLWNILHLMKNWKSSR